MSYNPRIERLERIAAKGGGGGGGYGSPTVYVDAEVDASVIGKITYSFIQYTYNQLVDLYNDGKLIKIMPNELYAGFEYCGDNFPLEFAEYDEYSNCFYMSYITAHIDEAVGIKIPAIVNVTYYSDGTYDSNLIYLGLNE